jgi:hypothetical protein
MRVTLAICVLAGATVIAGEHAHWQQSLVSEESSCEPLSSASKVLDRNLLERITRLLEHSYAPGYSLVVVRPGASEDVEYFTWGNRTEDGEPMTPEVRFLHIRFCILTYLS